MKHMNIVVSAIIIAAVLVAAYAVGLLVRHARMHGLSGPTAAETFKAQVVRQMPGGRYPRGADGNTPAQVRQQREQTLEKMKHMTEEEKHQFTEEQVRKRFGAGKPRVHEPSPKEVARTTQQRQIQLQDANQAPAASKGEPQTTAGQPPQTAPNPAPPATQQKPEQTPQPGGSESKSP